MVNLLCAHDSVEGTKTPRGLETETRSQTEHEWRLNGKGVTPMTRRRKKLDVLADAAAETVRDGAGRGDAAPAGL